LFVVISVLMFVYAMFGPAREQVPSRNQPSIVPAE
jgi:nitric oxide reductase subunit B